MKMIKLIWREIIYGGHSIPIGTASIVAVTGIFLNIKVSWDILLITYLVFYLILFFDRYRDLKHDSITNQERSKYLEKNYSFFSIIFYSLLVFLFILLIIFANKFAFLFVILVLIFGFLYPIFFKQLTFKVFLFKDLYVAMVFSLLVFFTRLYYSVDLFTRPAIILFSFFLLKAIIMQIFFDIKDTEGDRKRNLKTLSAIIGNFKALKILKTSTILVSLFIPIIFTLIFPVFSNLFLIFILIIPFNLYCFKLAEENNYFAYVLGSFEFLLWLVLAFIGNIFI